MPFSDRIKCPICGEDAHIIEASYRKDYSWIPQLSRETAAVEKCEYEMKCFNCDSYITISGVADVLENWRRKNAEAETDPDT